MTTVQAERICAALRTALEGQCFPARLHSRFREAANLDTPLGLVTLLSPRKCLQPYAVRLEEEMDYTVLEPGVLSLGSRGIAEEEGLFSLDDVIQKAGEKMIRRHPHVFSSEAAPEKEEVPGRWEAIKQAEKQGKSAEYEKRKKEAERNASREVIRLLQAES